MSSIVTQWHVHDLLGKCSEHDRYALVYDRARHEVSVACVVMLYDPTHSRYEIIARSSELEDYIPVEDVAWCWPAGIAEWVERNGASTGDVIDRFPRCEIDPWLECEGFVEDEVALEAAGYINEVWHERHASEPGVVA